MTNIGRAMDSRDMELKAVKMIQRKDFLLKRIRETPVISGDNAEWQIRDICMTGGEGIEGE